MTPEPKDLLRGASRTLTDVVLPALGDPFAIEQVKTVLRVLAHLEAVVDETYPLEAAEAADLQRFLGEVACSTDPALASLGSDDPIPAPSPLPSYRELRDANVRRKRNVTEVIRALARGASDPKIQAALDDFTRRQLGRERRWTNPGRPSK